MALSGVYIISHKGSRRRYVGSAVDIPKRWKEHRRGLASGRHHSRFLQRAWDKHGECEFEFRVALYCDRENLLMYEQRLIDGLKPEFNSAPTAGSQLGYRHSDEARKRMSAAHPRGFSPMKGRRHTAETKRRISENRKGKGACGWTQQRRDRIGAAHRGKVITTEQRKRISAKLTGTSTGRGQLNEAQVRDVRRLRAEGLGRIRISKRLNISTSAANAVIGGHAYGWVK